MNIRKSKLNDSCLLASFEFVYLLQEVILLFSERYYPWILSTISWKEGCLSLDIQFWK